MDYLIVFVCCVGLYFNHERCVITEKLHLFPHFPFALMRLGLVHMFPV